MRIDLALAPTTALVPLAVALARTGGFFLTTPFLSSGAVPLTVRAGLAAAVAWASLGIAPAAAEGLGAAGAVLLVAGELLVGVLFGVTVQLFFAALQLAGQMAGLAVGLSLARVMDPQAAVEDSIGPTVYQFVGLVLFVGAGGHRLLLEALLASYRIVPPGAAGWHGGLLSELVPLVGSMFAMGVRLAAPVAALLFAIDLVLALANRVAPQIPILMIGMPAKTWLGLAALGWGIAALAGPALVWLGGAPPLLVRLARLLAAGGSP